MKYLKSNSLSAGLTLMVILLTAFSPATSYAQSCPEQGTLLFPELTGQELLDELVEEYKTLTTPGYDTAREILYGIIDNNNGVVEGIYTGYKVEIDPQGNIRGQANNQYLNAEHSWPQSLGASGIAKSDMHHLYPSYANANSSRGNHPYYEIPDEETNSWWRYDETVTSPIADSINQYSERLDYHPNAKYTAAWEPRETVKGDIARGMFYFYTMYKAQADGQDPLFFEVQKEILQMWNQMDAVSDKEYARTCAIAGYQEGKVNPFVIDPTLAERAYFEGIISSTNLNFAASALIVNEAQNILEAEVAITNPNADTTTTVQVVYAGGTATPGVDFENFSSLNLEFEKGSYARQSFSITIFEDDEEEGEESILLALQNINGPENAVIGTVDTLKISIRDNDGETPTNIWVNEFHYDNDGTDTGEFIEIAVDAESANLSELDLTLYNGSNGSMYKTVNGSEFTTGETVNGITLFYVDFPSNGIQNGAPDGISLSINEEVVQFLSYEGVMTAVDGPAADLESTDIGAAQNGTESIGSSLYLTGKGRTYNQFTWAAANSSTKGLVNAGQEFPLLTSNNEEIHLAETIKLHQNYPNPFNPVTSIQFEMKQASQINLSVFNVLGERVALLADGRFGAGLHTLTFDASALASGVYFYRLYTNDQVFTQKMLLSK